MRNYHVNDLFCGCDKTLYILRDPVGLDKEDKITAMPRNGMEITFDASIFKPTELLTPSI